MDIRCGNCSKLFRVADEKISGKGIRFKCTKCAEIITITKQDFETDLAAREAAVQAPPASPVQLSHPSPTAPPATPAEPEAREYQPPPQPAAEFEAQEYKPPETPRAGLDDFDFSEPHDAAQHAQQEDFGAGGFSFDSAAEPEQAGSGEASISENEANDAEAAFSFPTEMISEPERKPAFAAEDKAGGGQEKAATGEETKAGDALDLGALETETSAQDQSVELELEPTTEPDRKKPADTRKGPVFTPSPKSGPVFAPPAGKRSAPSASNDDIDLAAALAVPRDEEQSASSREESGDLAGGRRPRTSSLHAEMNVHPLASGSLTGAVTGLCCGIAFIALMVFGLGLVAKFVPFLTGLPFYHTVAAASTNLFGIAAVGTGIFGLSVLVGVLVAIFQAMAGRKLFPLLNILIAAVFGAAIGAGMQLTVSLASGKGLLTAGLFPAAASAGGLAFLLGLVLAIVRRAMVYTKHETFSADMSGGQKAGLAISLVVVLFALYAQGSLIGKQEQSLKGSVLRSQLQVTPEGLSIIDPKAYIDPQSGDLVITGTVRNDLGRVKKGWYLEVNVYDAAQRVIAKVAMVNGVQLFSDKDWNILQKRGENIGDLRATMLLGLRTGEIPGKGNVPFELRLMNPPAGVAGFLPSLKKYDVATAFDLLSAKGNRR